MNNFTWIDDYLFRRVRENYEVLICFAKKYYWWIKYYVLDIKLTRSTYLTCFERIAYKNTSKIVGYIKSKNEKS